MNKILETTWERFSWCLASIFMAFIVCNLGIFALGIAIKIMFFWFRFLNLAHCG